MISRKAIITEYSSSYVFLYMEDDKALQIKFFDKTVLNNDSFIVGDIYLGEVFIKKENIDSTFINITKNRTGYLRGIGYKNGSLLPVMVKKLTTEDKKDIVTDELSVPGIYNVILNDKIIKRTNAKFVDSESVENEKNYLLGIFENINNIKDKRTKGSVLYKSTNPIISSVLSLSFDSPIRIITDIDEVKVSFDLFLQNYKEKNINVPVEVTLYDDSIVSLSALYSIKSKLNDALSKKVYLKSGSYLYIEHTEAMTVIDVNSGSTKFKGGKDETIHKVNLEAATEIAYQLVLRNLSGIIIVDFINTKNREYDEELISFLNKELKGDKRKAKCHGMTNLGLVEITRNRVDLPLYEQVKDQIRG